MKSSPATTAASPRRRNGGVLSRIYLPGPRLQVPAVPAGAGLRRPALAVAAEMEGLVASPTAWCTAVRHHPGAPPLQPRPVHLWRNVMGPRVRSYGARASVA